MVFFFLTAIIEVLKGEEMGWSFFLRRLEMIGLSPLRVWRERVFSLGDVPGRVL